MSTAVAVEAVDIKIDRSPNQFYDGEQTLKFGKLDTRAFNQIAQQAPAIDESVERIIKGEQEQMKDKGLNKSRVCSLAFDAYNSLVKNVIKPSGYGSPLVKELFERLQRAPEWNDLRQYTVSDDLASMMGAMGLTEKTIGSLSKELKAQDAKNEQAKSEKLDAEQFLEALEQDVNASEQDVKDARESLQEKKAAAQQVERALQSMIMMGGKNIAVAVASGASEALAQAQAVSLASNAFGIGSAQGFSSMPVEDKVKLAGMINKSGGAFRRLLILLGKLTREALSKQAMKTHHDAGAIVDVTMGNDLGAIMESELVLLRRPKLRKLMLYKFANESLSQYEVENKETLGRGDFIILFDESSSMSTKTTSGYAREAEAKAVTLAIANVALKQGRGIVVHFFQGSVTHTVHISPADYAMNTPSGNQAVRKLMEIAMRGTAGGTNFDAPILSAIESAKAGKDRADVIMLTDGFSSVTDETIKQVNIARTQRGVNFFSMLFGGAQERECEVVKQFSNHVWASESILGGASELFDLV